MERFVAYGTIEAMVAEYGAHEMPADWLESNGFTHCAMIVGAGQHDTEFAASAGEARQVARDTAAAFSIPVVLAS